MAFFLGWVLFTSQKTLTYHFKAKFFAIFTDTSTCYYMVIVKMKFRICFISVMSHTSVLFLRNNSPSLLGVQVHDFANSL